MVTRLTDVTDVTDCPTALRTSKKADSERGECIFPPNSRQSEKAVTSVTSFTACLRTRLPLAGTSSARTLSI